MENISKGSTPLIRIKCGVDPNIFSNAFLTFSQGFCGKEKTVVFEKSLNQMVVDRTAMKIEYTPTQAETILLDPFKPLFIQFRAADGNGIEAHSEIVVTTVAEILHRSVIA